MTEIATKTVLTRAQKFAARIATLTARIEKDTADLAAIKLESETAGAMQSVAPGTGIVARLGRAGSAAVEAVEALPERFAEDGVTVLPAQPAVAAKAATAGTLRHVEAVVLAMKEEENGSLRYKIEFGSGSDKDIKIIQASQIVSIAAAEAAPEVAAA